VRRARTALGAALWIGFSVAAAIALLVFGPHRSDLPDHAGGIPSWVNADPEGSLATLVGLAAWLIVIWLGVGIVFAVAATLPGAVGRFAGGLARRILPRTIRNLVEVSLGVSLVAGMAGPALAAPATAMASGGGPAVTASAASGGAPVQRLLPGLDHPRPSAPPGPTSRPSALPPTPGLDHPGTPTPAGPTSRPSALPPTPSRPLPRPSVAGTSPAASSPAPSMPAPSMSTASSPTPSNPTPTRSAPPAGGTGTPTMPGPGSGPEGSSTGVVVRAGDSLWTIAARSLGPHATNAEIAHEWPRWWAANRQLIGSDPNLIQPGLRLSPPPPGP
jgi:nucleoid-associated protein YgaU